MTSGTELALNAAVMSFTYDAVSQSGALSISTSTPADLATLVGVYTLKLKVHYEDFPLQFEEREFSVEVIDPCLSATLQIDQAGSVLTPAPTLIQYVTYAAIGVQWDSTLVSKSLAPANDPCGVHILELWQLDEGSSQVAIDASIFSLNAE